MSHKKSSTTHTLDGGSTKCKISKTRIGADTILKDSDVIAPPNFANYSKWCSFVFIIINKQIKSQPPNEIPRRMNNSRGNSTACLHSHYRISPLFNKLINLLTTLFLIFAKPKDYRKFFMAPWC